MSTAFLFIDECHSEDLDLAALIGVLVPVNVYGAIRDDMCQLVWDISELPPNHVPPPIELHGRDLLPDLSKDEKGDSKRFHVLTRVTEIVNSYRLNVCFLGYTNQREIADFIKGDQKIYDLTFICIRRWLDQFMETALVIPVMDGIPGSHVKRKPPRIDPKLIQAFAGQTRWLHHARRLDSLANSLDISNSYNLGETMFVDSAHSVLLQLTDLVSYLLHQIERDRAGARGSGSYCDTVLKIAEKLDDQLITRWTGSMKVGP